MSALAPTSPIQDPGERLTEAEQRLLVKLLRDPTYFPIEFKSWIKLFIEQSDIRINANQIYRGGGSGAGAAVELPAGIILGIPGSTYPSDCIPCDGRLLIRNDFVQLWQAIGAVWGAGDGTTSFNIPDLRDRALYGVGARVGLAATDGRALGSRGGPTHHHQFGQTSNGGGGHSHGFSGSGSTNDPGTHQHGPPSDNFALSLGNTAALGSGGSSRYLVSNYAFNTAHAGGHSHSVSVSGSTDGVGDHAHFVGGPTSGGYGQDTPSFAGINWVITTGK